MNGLSRHSLLLRTRLPHFSGVGGMRRQLRCVMRSATPALVMLVLGGCRSSDERPRVSEDASLLASPGVEDVVRQAGFSDRPEGIVYDPPTPLARADSMRTPTPR